MYVYMYTHEGLHDAPPRRLDHPWSHQPAEPQRPLAHDIRNVI